MVDTPQQLHPVISKTELQDEEDEEEQTLHSIHLLPEIEVNNSNNKPPGRPKVSPLQRNRLLDNLESPICISSRGTLGSDSVRPSVHSMSRKSIKESRNARRNSRMMVQSSAVILKPKELSEKDMLLYKLVKCSEDLKEHLHIKVSEVIKFML